MTFLSLTAFLVRSCYGNVVVVLRLAAWPEVGAVRIDATPSRVAILLQRNLIV